MEGESGQLGSETACRNLHRVYQLTYVYVYISKPKPIKIACRPFEVDLDMPAVKQLCPEFCKTVRTTNAVMLPFLELFGAVDDNGVQLDCFSWRRTRIINLVSNQKGYDTFKTTVGKLSTRRIQIFPGYFCLGNI